MQFIVDIYYSPAFELVLEILAVSATLLIVGKPIRGIIHQAKEDHRLASTRGLLIHFLELTLETTTFQHEYQYDDVKPTFDKLFAGISRGKYKRLENALNSMGIGHIDFFPNHAKEPQYFFDKLYISAEDLAGLKKEIKARRYDKFIE